MLSEIFRTDLRRIEATFRLVERIVANANWRVHGIIAHSSSGTARGTSQLRTNGSEMGTFHVESHPGVHNFSTFAGVVLAI